MKKGMVSVGILGSLLLAGCTTNTKDTASNNSETKASVTEITAEKESSERDAIEMSFKDGTLEGLNYKLTIDKTQLAHDNFSGEDGLIIWYTLENNTETNLVPRDNFSMFSIKQQDETSEYDLSDSIGTFSVGEALYPMYDENGNPLEDTEAYNAAIDEQNKFHDDYEVKSDAELLPGKSVQTVTSVVLNNTEGQVKIKLPDDFPTSENQELVVNLK